MEKEITKIALITGGGSGLGLAITRALIENGIFVCIFGREKGRTFQLLDEKEKEKICFFEVDVTNVERVNHAVQEVIYKFGYIDILINNAGKKLFKNIAEITYKTWRDVIDVNLSGPFVVTKAVLSHMADKKYGVIINIASKAGYRGYSGGSAYCSSKAGLMRLTESIAADIQGSGICICAICPSTVATPDVLVENPELSKSILLKPKYIGRVVLKIISSPEKYKNRCIMLSKPKILLKTFVLVFMDTFFDLIDNYRFRR